MRQFKPMLLSDAVCFTTDGLIRFKDIKPYYVLGAQCAKCKSLVRLDRQAMENRYGRNAVLYHITRRLRCKSCQNATGNTILIIDQWPR